MAKKVEKEQCECNCGCNCNETNDYIKYSFYTLAAIFVCVFISTIFIIMIAIDKENSNKNQSTSNNQTTTNTGTNTNNGGNDVEYDVSMFKEITADELVNKFNGEEKSLIYIGRKTCGYCVAFLPMLQQAQEEFGYQTYYYDIDTITQDAYDKIVALSPFLENSFGSTPMVLVVQNGQILSADGSGDGWVGYAEYETFKDYLINLGY